MPLAERIQKGKRLPTVICALAGAGVGASTGLVLKEATLPAAILGGIGAAALAASWFPRESRPPGSSGSCSSHPAPGLLIRIWISQNRLVPFFTFMFERGVYVALSVDNRQCSDLVDTIARGAIPEIPAGRLVPLDSIESLEISESDELTLAFCYMADSRRLRRSTAFPTIAARDEFIALIEAYHGARFDSELRSVGFLRATMAPLIVLLMLGALFAAAAGASVYWTTHPPPPPVGETELDWLVRLFVWLGPSNLLLAGGVPSSVALGWLLKRAIRPPRVRVLSKSRRNFAGRGAWFEAVVDAWLYSSGFVGSVGTRRITIGPPKRHNPWAKWWIAALILTSCSVGVFVGILIERSKTHLHDAKEKQEQLDHDLDEQIKAVREGKVKAGEAFRRMFNIEPPDKDRPR
jgi:hypothetical protein